MYLLGKLLFSKKLYAMLITAVLRDKYFIFLIHLDRLARLKVKTTISNRANSIMYNDK